MLERAMTIQKQLMATLSGFIFLAGCTADDPSSTPSPTDGVELLIAEDLNRSGEANIAGKLVRDGDCLVVELGDSSYVAIFQEGTELTPEGVKMPNGAELAIGDNFEAGGEIFTSRVPSYAPPIPAECTNDGVVLIGEV